MNPTPDTRAALDFLTRWRREGPWVLSAIIPDGGGIQTQTFTDLGVAGAWIEAKQGKFNLYFTVNPLKHAVSSKPKKEDVAAMASLHVDIDPKEGEDLEREQTRIYQTLEAFTPPPTVIVASGGGYQAFWRFEESVPIQAEADIAVLESYNVHLAHQLTGDSCHSIEHLMRLPGTINVPGEKKKKRGRVLALAQVVKADWEKVYSLRDFTQAEVEQPQAAVTLADIGVEQLGNIDDLDKWGCPSWVKVVITKGQREEPDNRYPSRSEALFAVVSALCRQGVPAEVIMGIQLDPRFEISSSVREKPKPADYARRQIESALTKTKVPTTVDEVVKHINQHYFAIQEAGKIAFYREEGIDLDPLRPETFEFELKPYYLITHEEGQPPKRSAYSKLWVHHTNRRYYPKGFVLEPHREAAEGSYNLWKGFWVEPRQGSWALMQNHILEVLAHGNAEYADYITKWAAWAIRNPSTPAKVALVFKGGEGAGKGIFCNALAKLFGAHGLRIHNMLHLVGRFNAHLRLCCLLFADEAVAPNREEEGALKGLISEPTIPIERKGYDTVDSPNRLHVVMATNNEWAVPSGHDARRFAVFRVAETHKKDTPYFNALGAELSDGGMAAMLHDLLNIDLKGWHPEANRPETKELINQKVFSLRGVESLWFDYLKQGYLPAGARKITKAGFLLPTKDFTDEAAERAPYEKVTMNKAATFLGEKMGFPKYRESRPSGYLVPPLAEARKLWDERMFKCEWDFSERWDIDTDSPF